MAQENPNRLVEWWELLRTQPPILRRRFGTWLDAVREEPVLLWETPAIRYSTYFVGLLLGMWVISATTHMLTPQLPADARPAAATADFHVVCVNAECGKHFVINREFGFDDFPVTCPTCQGETGLMARRCMSEACNGRWVTAGKDEKGIFCPICGATFE